MSVERRRLETAFLLRWVLATTLGGALAAVIGGGVFVPIIMISVLSGDSVGPFWLVFAAALVGLGLSILGVAQRVVLRPYITTIKWWARATTLGAAAGVGMAAYVYGNLHLDNSVCELMGLSPYRGCSSASPWQTLVAGGVNGAAAGTLFGACLGLAQSLALLEHFPKVQWYVLGSSLGGFVGGLSFGMGELAGSILHVGAAVAVGIALGALIFSAITGLTLISLLRRLPPRPPGHGPKRQSVA
jgi:hypothetical protein